VYRASCARPWCFPLARQAARAIAQELAKLTLGEDAPMSFSIKPSGERGHWRERLAFASAGVVIGALIVVGTISASGFGLQSHTSCVRGPIVADENLWTPFALANSPYLGWTGWNASFSLIDAAGPANYTLTDGFLGRGNLSTGYFQTQNWSVSTQTNQSTMGPGRNQPCSAGFVAMISPPNFSSASDGPPLQGPGNTSNLGEPATFSPDGRPAAVFDNGFVSANQPQISTCGGPSKEVNFNSSSFDISISVNSTSGPLSIAISISSIERFTYFFPANDGTWLVDDLQENAGLRGPGLAFSWQPC